MSDESELTRQHLQAMADYLMLQYGTVLFLKLAYVTLFFVLTGVLFGWRRIALFFLFLTGVCTFLVPSNLTMIGSPIIVAVSLLGSGWLTLRRRKEKRFRNGAAP